ncbi:MAG: hypothetical protein PHT71_09130, partial [Victivallaceae bacterium]|nr:hypothetical protein [Victivallaceae bacterium]
GMLYLTIMNIHDLYRYVKSENVKNIHLLFASGCYNFSDLCLGLVAIGECGGYIASVKTHENNIHSGGKNENQ